MVLLVLWFVCVVAAGVSVGSLVARLVAPVFGAAAAWWAAAVVALAVGVAFGLAR